MALIDLLPRGMYADNVTMQELQSIMDSFIDQLKDDVDNTIDNCFILSADALLSRYEAICDIPTDPSLSNQVRAEAIISKLRGTSTCTIAALKNVIGSYFAEAGVSEDYANYFFSVVFCGSFSDVDRLQKLKKDVESIKPAHLDFDMRFQDQENGSGYLGSCAETVVSYTFETETEANE